MLSKGSWRILFYLLIMKKRIGIEMKTELTLSLLFFMYKVLITSHCSVNYYKSYPAFTVPLNDEKLEFPLTRIFWFCMMDLLRGWIPTQIWKNSMKPFIEVTIIPENWIIDSNQTNFNATEISAHITKLWDWFPIEPFAWKTEWFFTSLSSN